MNGPLQRRMRVELEFEYSDWFNETPFGCLREEPVLDTILIKHLKRFDEKASAVIHKWTMLQISGAELDVLCRSYAHQYSKALAIPLEVQLYITCKVESFLMLARSLLDVLSTNLSIWLCDNSRASSFNDLRKKGGIPQWLKEYINSSLLGTGGKTSLEELGWLTLLVSQSNVERSLRDFVTHQGTPRFTIRTFDLEEGDVDLAFCPRPGDSYGYSVIGVKHKILLGIKSLAELIDAHKSEASVTD